MYFRSYQQHSSLAELSQEPRYSHAEGQLAALGWRLVGEYTVWQCHSSGKALFNPKSEGRIAPPLGLSPHHLPPPWGKVTCFPVEWATPIAILNAGYRISISPQPFITFTLEVLYDHF